MKIEMEPIPRMAFPVNLESLRESVRARRKVIANRLETSDRVIRRLAINSTEEKALDEPLEGTAGQR